MLSDDSLIVNDNVYVASIVIWNNGGLEIQKSDVRKDFIIFVSEKAKILDYKILNQVKPEISKFKLIPVQNVLKLDWQYFDPGFGAEIQLIYSGNEKSKIQVDGYVLGCQITNVTLAINNWKNTWPIIIGFVGCGILYYFLGISTKTKWLKIFAYVISFGCSLALLMTLLENLTSCKLPF